jgi:hypothetical protein
MVAVGGIETGKRERYQGGNDGSWNAIVGYYRYAFNQLLCYKVSQYFILIDKEI